MDIFCKEVESTRILSPKSYQKLENIKITYFCDESLFGNYLAAFWNDELCFLGFYDSNMETCLKKLEQTFKNAELIHKEGFQPPNKLRVLLLGTDFEAAVWHELLKIKKGSTVSYNHIAEAIGKPKAVRAVGNAVGKNHVAYVVPCHRIISKSGGLGGFSCGPHRKLKMLKYEGVRF